MSDDLVERMNAAMDKPHAELLQFFSFAHLPEHLQAISRPFAEHAVRIVETLPANPERTAALRKLVEAKDCAVRALIWKPRHG